MRYVIYFEDLIRPEEYAHRPDAARAITERYTRALERLVRRHPEQYFWLHRRWKSEPPRKKARKGRSHGRGGRVLRGRSRSAQSAGESVSDTTSEITVAPAMVSANCR